MSLPRESAATFLTPTGRPNCLSATLTCEFFKDQHGSIHFNLLMAQPPHQLLNFEQATLRVDSDGARSRSAAVLSED
jgi:hypothetical protein